MVQSLAVICPEIFKCVSGAAHNYQIFLLQCSCVFLCDIFAYHWYNIHIWYDNYAYQWYLQTSSALVSCIMRGTQKRCDISNLPDRIYIV